MRGKPNFYVCSQEEAILALRKIGDRTCCYGGKTWPRRCDCKYGGPDIPSNGSEQTGCPELATVFFLLQNMTPNEWAEIVGPRQGGLDVFESKEQTK